MVDSARTSKPHDSPLARPHQSNSTPDDDSMTSLGAPIQHTTSATLLKSPQLRPADVLRLQASIGNQATQRLLQRQRDGGAASSLGVADAPRMPFTLPRKAAQHQNREERPVLAADPNPPVDTISRAEADQLQRAIGFELEIPAVKVWQPTGLWGQQKAMNSPNRRKRLKKGEAFITGDGFELQGEDDPTNANESVIEFVTKAFPDGLPGFQQLTNAMATMTGVANAMHNNAVANQFLDVNTLPQTKVKPKAFLEDADGNLSAKIQSTFGVDFAKVAQFMEEVFATARGTDARLHEGHKDLTGYTEDNPMTGNPMQPGPILRAVGGAPAKARTALDDMRLDVKNTPDPTPEMNSLLSLVIAYLDIGGGVNALNQPLVRSYAKTIAPVMSRTDFSSLFNMLSDEEKSFYRPNNGAAWKRLVGHVPSLAALNVPVFTTGIWVNGAANHDLDGLTRQIWLEGMANGVDLLTPSTFPDKGQRGQIEGLGAYKGKTDQLASGKSGPIFELRAMTRAMDPLLPMGGAGKYPVNEWGPLAQKLFMYVFYLNHDQDLRYGE